MTQQEALSIIKEACASIQANLATHNQVQLAIQVIEDSLIYTDDKGNIFMAGAKPPSMNVKQENIHGTNEINGEVQPPEPEVEVKE